MKKLWMGLIAVVLVGGIAILAFGENPPAASPAQATVKVTQTSSPVMQDPELIEPVSDGDEVNVEGRLVPLNFVDLSFNIAGLVQEVLVKEGDIVKAGQTLARLHNQEQTLVNITSAQLEVADAQKAINDLKINAPMIAAQAAYDVSQAKKDLKEARQKRQAVDYPRATAETIDLADAKYQDAQDDLDRVQDMYDAASQGDRKLLIDALEAAKKARDNALANLNYKKSKPTEAEIAEADARLALAEAKVADLVHTIEIYQSGPNPDELRIAEARLENANTKVDAAQAALQDLELRAPFDGTIVSMTLKVGQYINPGESALTLADFSKWFIQTTNLTELSVLSIKTGNLAQINFDALPGVTFPGKVTYIKSLGENQLGDITYTALIELSKTDPRLRWNMTAPVVIQTR